MEEKNGKEKWIYNIRNDDRDVDRSFTFVDYFAKIQQKEKIIRNKGCEALLEIVNSQIMLYEIDQLETPTSVQELIDFGYLKKGQDTCPDHSQVVIENGQAISK